jgi:hypothetical protein
MTNAAGSLPKADLEDAVVSTSEICFIDGPSYVPLSQR